MILQGELNNWKHDVALIKQDKKHLRELLKSIPQDALDDDDDFFPGFDIFMDEDDEDE
ncbi:MAG: hypothetical protein HC880_06255 [Bacteroidia bacterium]|nr:hypothetical protein [Bacteroidia bacterium]